MNGPGSDLKVRRYGTRAATERGPLRTRVGRERGRLRWRLPDQLLMFVRPDGTEAGRHRTPLHLPGYYLPWSVRYVKGLAGPRMRGERFELGT